jgi:LacI family transcriptional regulator
MGASMKDVARLANVSIATVSHVINKTRNVNKETEEKVIKAIKDLNYFVNPVARNLRNGNSKVIGYVVSNLANTFFMDIALSIDKIMSENGYHLIYINSSEDTAKERNNIESLLMHNVDGLIIAPVGKDCSYMENLIADRCPCVFFDRKPIGFDRDVIMSTNREGALDGTEHLISKGHRNIGYVASRYDETMHERSDGFKAALIKHGLKINEDLILSGSGRPRPMDEQSIGDSYLLAKDLIINHKVTALFCSNILAAVGVNNFILENPDLISSDFAVTSFDDAFWYSMVNPRVSAVKQDKEAIGETVAKTLMKRINKSDEPIQEYRIPTTLIPR